MVIRRTTMASNSSIQRTTAYDQSVGYRRTKVDNQNAASKNATKNNQNAASKNATTYNQNTVSTSSKSTKTSTSSRYPVTYSSNNSSKPLTVNVTSKGVALNKSGKFFDDPVDDSKKYHVALNKSGKFFDDPVDNSKKDSKKVKYNNFFGDSVTISKEARNKSSNIKSKLSTAADLIPGVSNVKSGIEAITGKDPITGKKLTKTDRTIAASGIILPGAVKTVAKTASKGTKIVSKGIGNTPKKVNYGEQYTKVNGRKVLKPNIEYKTNEGYRYKTDSEGRISNVEATLQLGKADRNNYAQRTIGREDRLPNDDGGHLIANIFKGSGEIDNLVPMNATLNRKEYRALETSWKKALEAGKTVKVKIEPIYKVNSSRPSNFEVEYKIDGKKYEVSLVNYNRR